MDKDGKPHARVRDRGKWVLFPLSADGKQYLKPALMWAAGVRLADDTRRRMRFSPNRDASAVMLADLIKKIEAERSGVRDQYADHRAAELSALLSEYEQHVRDKGATPKEAAQAARRCTIVFESVRFTTLRDLSTAPVEHWLAEKRELPKGKGAFGPTTSNHYRKSLVACGNWLVRSRRVHENEFRHIPKENAKLDVRHKRRALSTDGFARLLNATRGGEVFRGLTGAERAALYTVAGMTGLRASELASLSPRSFLPEADPPVVVVEAAYSKHRRRDEVPLHADLVHELSAWLAGKADGPLWSGNWAKHTAAVYLIKRDLEVARGAWIAEGATDDERERRTNSVFLLYRDRDGRVADFHALRHTLVANLVNAGVAPKDAKELARHSTITLTMDHYAHVGVRDTAAALSKLRLPTQTNPRESGSGAADSDDERGQAETNGDERRSAERRRKQHAPGIPWKRGVPGACEER